jgi:hypothetical protein
MPSTINADRGIVSGITGIVQTADNTGNLTLQANGVSVLTVDTSNAVSVTGLVSATGNVTGGNLITAGRVSATGNIQGSYLLGNGSALTGIVAGVSWANVQSANLTAASGTAYPINTTSSAIWVTLPASPSAGNYVQLVDYARTWTTNNVTLNPNGQKINASTSNVALSTNGQGVILTYIDSTQGWICTLSGNSVGPYTVTYLIVAGGAAGGVRLGGGGGAGGLITGTASVTPGSSYSLVVGAGGAQQVVSVDTLNQPGASGTNSTGFGFTSIGGGGGAGTDSFPGVSGGSGGGGGRPGTPSGGAGTAGQGNPGGSGNGGVDRSGGGGGYASAGAAGSAGGNGGTGYLFAVTGTYYAGGGGGTAYTGTGTLSGGPGGAGGGGPGGNANTGTVSIGTSGGVNTGGGGGGGGYPTSNETNGAGGSGVVIVAYLGSAARASGGTVSFNNGYVIHTFASSGIFTA